MRPLAVMLNGSSLLPVPTQLLLLRLIFQGIADMSFLMSFATCENEFIYFQMKFSREKRWLAATLRMGIGNGNYRYGEREREMKKERET